MPQPVRAPCPRAVRECDEVPTAERGRAQARIGADDVDGRGARGLRVTRAEKADESDEQTCKADSTGHAPTIRRVRLVAIGLVAGVFSAFFGVGGGIVAVPLLILLAGFAQRAATATSLMAIAITASAGVVAYGIRGEVDVGYAALVGLPAAVGAIAGSAWQQRISVSTLAYAFAALLCAVAVWLVAA